MEQVAYGALETPIHSDALLLQVQIDLYQTLDENPQLLQESEILEYFYQTVNLSEWAELLNALQEMEEMDDAGQIGLSDILKLRMDTLVAWDSTSVTDSVIDSVYYQKRKGILGRIQQTTTKIDTLNDTIRELRQTLVGLARLGVQSVNTNLVVNDNLLKTDKFWLDSIPADSLTSLWQIANQCPLAGGQGVFQARALLTSLFDVDWNDYDRCLDQGYSIYKNEPTPAHDETSPIGSGIVIFPNPATDKVQFEVLDAKQLPVNVVFFDMLGNSKKAVVLNELRTEINIADLATSAYLLNVEYANDTESDKVKLVIVR